MYKWVHTDGMTYVCNCPSRLPASQPPSLLSRGWFNFRFVSWIHYACMIECLLSTAPLLLLACSNSPQGQAYAYCQTDDQKRTITWRNERRVQQAFFWTFPQKLKVKKTKTQAKKPQNSRILCPKLKIPANFSEI